MYERPAATDWSKKVILVTGATSGLGNTATECLADAGAQVIAAARRDKIMAMYNEYPNVTPFQCDVRDYEQVKALIAMIKEKFGRIDVVVNVAGRGGKPQHSRTRIHNYPVEEFEDQFKTNVFGMFYVTREAIGLMMEKEERNKGLIINISSSAAVEPTSGGGGYSPSKAAVSMLTDLVSKEYTATGIRAVEIQPGFFPNTDIFAGRPKEQLDYFASMTAMGRAAQNWEFAELVKYLASDDSSYMTGTHVAIDGGTACGANDEINAKWNGED